MEILKIDPQPDPQTFYPFPPYVRWTAVLFGRRSIILESKINVEDAMLHNGHDLYPKPVAKRKMHCHVR